MAYGLNDRPSWPVLALSTIQWFVFMLANVITVPIVLAHAFHLSPHDAATMTSHTFLACGVVSLLQVLLGHRLPVIEGPAGMWWGVFMVLIQMTEDVGGSLSSLQQNLEMGLVAAGIFNVLLVVLGLLKWVRKLFTPVVTGTFLILLSLQLSSSLVSGLLGIGYQGHQTVVPGIAISSLALVCLTIGLMAKGSGMVRSLAVLIGIGVGWVAYAVLGWTPPVALSHAGAIEVPALFPWGVPVWNGGIIITSVLTTLILLTNLIASVQAMGSAIDEPVHVRQFERGTLVSGIGNAFAGVLGTVGVVPLTAAASLVSLTGIAARLPFLLGSILLGALGLFPGVGQLAVTLPAPVGYAVLFTVFGQLLGFGLRDYQTMALDQRDIFVISISILSGVGIFFLSGRAWSTFPPMLAYLLDNGLIVGIVAVLLLEHVIFRRKPAAQTP